MIENVSQEVVRAAKIINRFIVDNKLAGVFMDQIGGMRLYNNEENYEYLSPMAQDMFLSVKSTQQSAQPVGCTSLLPCGGTVDDNGNFHHAPYCQFANR